MGRLTYYLIDLPAGDILVLGEKVGFKKDAGKYSEFNEKLQGAEPTKVGHGTDYQIGQHVLIKSKKMEGFRRGIVHQKRETENKLEYYVFLYDEGVFESVSYWRMHPLSEEFKELNPRAVVVRVPGLVPAKQIINLDIPPDENGLSFTAVRDLEWSNLAKDRTKGWLTSPNVRYIAFNKLKVLPDGTIYGDVFLKERYSDALSQPSTSSDGSSKEKLFLKDFLVEKMFALFKEDLRASQVTGIPFVEPPYFPMPSKCAALLKQAEEEKARESPLPVACVANSIKLDDLGGQLKHYVKPDLHDSRASHIDILNDPGYILVRGKNLRKPFKGSLCYGLDESLKMGLRSLKVETLSRYQLTIAPNFYRFMNIIGISADGGTDRGKHMRALAYLLPMLQLMYSKYTTNEFQDENEPPEAVIVVSSYNYGEKLVGFINQLLGSAQHLSLKVRFMRRDGELSREAMTKGRGRMVEGGCGIVIITADYLSNVLTTSDGPFLFSGMKYLVFEELDDYVTSHYDDIATFFAAAMENMKLSGYQIPFQVTMSGAKWDNLMENLYHQVTNDAPPMIVISAPNQVLRYSNANFNVEYTANQEDRWTACERAIQVYLKTHKQIIVACSTSHVGKTLRKFLKAPCQLVIDESTCSSANDWQTSAIVIVSDEVLHQVKISEATCLINLDTPVKGMWPGRSVQAERFRYVWSNIRHVVPANTSAEINNTPVQAHFFFDGTEESFFNFYKFVISMPSCEVSPELRKIAGAMKSNQLKTTPFCDDAKLFGSCKKGICNARHFFNPDELAEKVIPDGTEVEVNVIRALNPSLYNVTLNASYVFVRGKRVKDKDYLAKFQAEQQQLNDYFKDKENRIVSDNFEVGSWCCAKLPGSETYLRAKVIRIIFKDQGKELPETVRVNCVDTGDILNPPGSNVFYLPPDFRKIPPYGMNVVLCNLKPGKDEAEYRATNEKRARQLTAGKTFACKVYLSTRDTLYVNPMVEYAVDEVSNKTFKLTSIRRQLILDGAAVSNPNHLEDILDLAGLKKADMEEVSDEEDEFPFADEFAEPHEHSQHAHLDLKEPISIVTQYGYDPWLFYGVIETNWEAVQQLQKDLNKYVNRIVKEPRFAQYYKYLQVGLPVAAKDDVGGDFNRGLITETREDEDGGIEYRVFFLDFGDRQYVKPANLFFLPRKFIARLPFQVIAFSLANIEPVRAGDNWENVEDEFLEWILGPASDSVGKLFTAIPYEKLTSGEVREFPHGVRYYSVVMKSQSQDLSEAAVDKGIAKYVDGQENLSRDLFGKVLEGVNQLVLQDLDDDLVDEQDSCDNLYVTDNFDAYFPGLEEILQGRELPKPEAASRAILPAVSENDEEVLVKVEEKQKPVVLQESDGYRHPQVEWGQDGNTVYFTIKVTDVKEYGLIIENDRRTIDFKTKDDRGYGFKLKLYGKLKPKEICVTLTGQCVRLKLKKYLPDQVWPRLLFEKDGPKLKWLSEDVDRIPDEDEHEDDATQLIPLRAFKEDDGGKHDDDVEEMKFSDEELEEESTDDEEGVYDVLGIRLEKLKGATGF